MGRAYECRGCKARQLKPWRGPCPVCRYWFNWREVASDDAGADTGPIADGSVVSLCDVEVPDIERIESGMLGSDRVIGNHPRCGNGLAVAGGQAVQIYGSPGGGKSTWLLQLLRGYAKQRHDCLYVAVEETIEQIKGRADRIGKFRPNMLIVRETELDRVLECLDERRPKIAVVDSINEVAVDEFAPGTTSAIKTAAREIVKVCKDRNVGAFIVVQVGKDGDFSGPKALEHIVDTSLVMHGIESQPRILKAKKNRFGVTSSARFRMTDAGLVEAEESDAEPEPEPSAPPPEPPPAARPQLAVVPALRSVPDVDDAVLAVNCEVPDCRGQKGRACTSASGAPEAGFHASRVAAAKRGAVQPAAVEENEDPLPPDPFGGGGLKGKPRIRRRDLAPTD